MEDIAINEKIDAIKWFHSHECFIKPKEKLLFFVFSHDSGIGINVFAVCTCGMCSEVTDYKTW